MSWPRREQGRDANQDDDEKNDPSAEGRTTPHHAPRFRDEAALDFQLDLAID